MDDFYVSDKDALEGRKQEMERDILPGMVTMFTLPNSKRVEKVYSKKINAIFNTEKKEDSIWQE